MNTLLSYLTLFLLSVFLLSCSAQVETTGDAQVDDKSVESDVSIELDELNNDTNDEGTFYSLDWKIDDEEVVAYSAAMNQIDSAESSFSFNLDQFFPEEGIPDEVRQQLNSLEFPDSQSMISILEPRPNGNIAIKMIVHELDIAENASDNEMGQAFNELMGAMVGTVQLRGEISPEGEVTSFYLEQKQRNLVAMFFELPTESVQVGDNWEIDVNCIAMGNGYIADDAQRINRVELAEVIEDDEGRSVAVLDYIIAETVEGAFQLPMSDELVPTTMECSFLGRGYFLIEEGRWARLNGEFAINATGLMEADTVQELALTPTTDFPEEYIGLK